MKQILVPSGEIDGWNEWAPLIWISSVELPVLFAGSWKIFTSLVLPFGATLTSPAA